MKEQICEFMSSYSMSILQSCSTRLRTKDLNLEDYILTHLLCKPVIKLCNLWLWNPMKPLPGLQPLDYNAFRLLVYEVVK